MNKTPDTRVIVLRDDQVRRLMREVRGEGGFQSLLRDIQNHISSDKLTLSPSLRQKVVRYALKYGDGGFQRRLAGITDFVTRN